MNVDALMAQAEQCRRNRKDADDFCVRPCRRCTRCRAYRAEKQEAAA